MTYQKEYQQTTWQNATAELLRVEDGICTAWATFLIDCFRIQGIPAAYLAITPADPPPGFGVNPLLWRYSPEYLWVKQWQGISTREVGVNQRPSRGAPALAQGGTDPAGFYKDHVLVYRQSQAGVEVYDPSYGNGPYECEGPESYWAVFMWQQASLNAVSWWVFSILNDRETIFYNADTSSEMLVKTR